jgi:uncharacterized protein (TIGR02453 family)
MAAGYFTPELFEFLRQLKRNNRRDWFAKNKDRYLRVVQAPALEFISAMSTPLEKMSPHFVADARPTRGSLFRIYRDTRFSADKKPYKTHIGIQFRHEKGKDAHAPGFYLHLEPQGCFAAAGIWHPDNRTLTRLRTAIVAQPDRWRKAVRGIELGGESLTRPPKGFAPQHPLIQDLKRKDYVASVLLTDKQICGAKVVQDVTAAFLALLPLVEFTTRALELPF